ncbi:leukocyte receptor cluster member 1 [Canna indica]|uniref:Leukocyte receptor cluster member 1 n=1 Tax=Canna indica TaxID=4628 RepID=A0AAQ3Q5R4_9LILI|nr:leukocyte receptor cluster member 1 [Canna indica]
MAIANDNAHEHFTKFFESPWRAQHIAIESGGNVYNYENHKKVLLNQEATAQEEWLEHEKSHHCDVESHLKCFRHAPMTSRSSDEQIVGSLTTSGLGKKSSGKKTIEELWEKRVRQERKGE